MSQTDTGDDMLVRLKMDLDISGYYSFLVETVTATLVMLAER